MTALALDKLATLEDFDEDGYLATNPDVAGAVRRGEIRSGREHLIRHGIAEGRRMRSGRLIRAAQVAKLTRITPLLRLELPHVGRGPKFDFLTDELRAATGIIDTDAVSAHGYDGYVEGLVRELSDGLVLDCGAGRRPVYFSNVVNFEIVDYDTTDIIGVGEQLPFIDNAFDAVLSLSVLEHVRDPFQCASEIVRVLKPGGKLICSVPFLQPEHGYPHHYYNMAPQGIRALFERMLVIDDHKVLDGNAPIYALAWILKSWSDGLDGAVKERFLDLKVSDFLKWSADFDLPWINNLSERKRFELACATMIFAHKG